VAALFDDLEQAELALSELEKSGFSPDSIGMAHPRQGRTSEAGSSGLESKAAILAGAPTSGYPGWTMGMTPWSFGGAGHVVVLGSLALRKRDDGPDDLRGFLRNIGLHEDDHGPVEQRFQRGGVLVTVDPGDKAAIASNILDRNGGHSLRRRGQ
jgi:hypothetical protein